MNGVHDGENGLPPEAGGRPFRREMPNAKKTLKFSARETDYPSSPEEKDP
jgi:hypothetical protein